MDQRKAEKLLTSLYVVCVVASLITSITSGVSWGHWRWTLDQCPNYNCSCILYGESTPTHFHGGNMWTCIWISFGPIPVILVFASLAIYHGIRSCFGPNTEATRSVMTKNESGEMIHMQIHTSEISPINLCYWITASTLSCLFALYMFSHFTVFTDGYYYTCKQYKRRLVEMLHLSGIAVDVVHTRLNCNTVLDFMDYLNPPYNNYFRDNFINTAAALLIGIITSFISTACLAYASLINIRFSRQND